MKKDQDSSNSTQTHQQRDEEGVREGVRSEAGAEESEMRMYTTCTL